MSYSVNIVKISEIHMCRISVEALCSCTAATRWNVGDTLRLFIAKHLKPRNIGRTLHVPQAAVRSRVMWRAIAALLRTDICIVDFSDRIHSATNSYASLRT